jgi:iron complex outermembrane receptor protein
VASIGNGDAYTEGVEFESTWQPLAETNWIMSANGAYTNAYWGAYANAPCYSYQSLAAGCTAAGVQDLTGKQLPFAPKWTIDLESNYSTKFPNEPWDLGFNMGVSYHSDEGIAFPNDPSTIQTGFALVNASISLACDDGSWRLALFGKNLTDHYYAATLFGTPFGTGYSQFPLYEARRIIGLSLDIRN